MAAITTACKTTPPAIDPYPLEEEEVSAPNSSLKISQEMYDFTLAEVKLFVDDLNAMIQKKDYNGWKAALSDEFFGRISSPEFLASASESAILKSRKIVLKTPNDYFLQVVVPSRSNSKVDEIEFTAIDRVKVFYLEERRRNENNTTTTESRRLRLYELIKIDDTWKVID
jgi:hypothetical protein